MTVLDSVRGTSQRMTWIACEARRDEAELRDGRSGLVVKYFWLVASGRIKRRKEETQLLDLAILQAEENGWPVRSNKNIAIDHGVKEPEITRRRKELKAILDY